MFYISVYFQKTVLVLEGFCLFFVSLNEPTHLKAKFAHTPLSKSELSLDDKIYWEMKTEEEEEEEQKEEGKEKGQKEEDGEAEQKEEEEEEEVEQKKKRRKR